jgi:hypothetical protein
MGWTVKSVAARETGGIKVLQVLREMGLTKGKRAERSGDGR